jgi:hypothetical protein
MNTHLAELFGTDQVATAEPDADELLLDELEKTAAANGIDLNELSDEQITDILSSVKTEREKVASGQHYEDDDVIPGLPSGVTMEKVASAKYLGEVMAHACVAELSNIETHREKVASMSPVEARALEILNAATVASEGVEKVAEDDEVALNAAALEYLEANDYDVDAIVNILS